LDATPNACSVKAPGGPCLELQSTPRIPTCPHYLPHLNVGICSLSRRQRLSTKEATRRAAMLASLKNRARALKRDVSAICIARRDPRVPWYAKALAIVVAAYALSPIDLIPDFIPVLGHLDDLIIVPLGIWLVIALIPADVMAECRALATGTATVPQTEDKATGAAELMSSSGNVG
jgi:uncharacterized membrane protein YkvA (DUF1232 family)